MIDPNSSRTIWQKEVIRKWIEINKAKGFTEICTGAGKSYIGILAIKLANERHPDKQINVVVPSTMLSDAWLDEKKGHIAIHGLKNVNVYVINSYVKDQHECGLLIIDEVQRSSNEKSKLFSTVISRTKFNWILCLTATLEKEHKEFLLKYNITLIEKFTAQQGVDAGWLSPYKILCLPVDLSETDRIAYDKMHSEFNRHFAVFGFDFNLAMKCVTDYKEREELAKKLSWEKSRIDAAVFNWNRNMRLRKEFLYHIQSKIDMAVTITKNLNMQTILFGQSIAGADYIAEKLGDSCVEYHSKMSKKQAKENLKRLKDGRTKITQISSAKGLEEGFDLPNLQLGIRWSRTSKALSQVQSNGRLLRYYSGKTAYFIELFVEDSQDEVWLKNSLRGQKNVFYLKNEEQIYDIINADNLKREQESLKLL